MAIPTRISMKKAFFDRKAVIDALDDAKLKALSKAGAFVRTRSRSSIRKRKGSSIPGRPPSSHTGLLKNNIFFAYDSARNSVIIGPAKLNKPTTAPEVLEHGGTTTVTRLRHRNGKLTRQSTRVRVEARPFMLPALQKEMPNFPSLWANTIGR